MKTKETNTLTDMRGRKIKGTKSPGKVEGGSEGDSGRSKSDGDVGAVCRNLSLRFTNTLPVRLQVLNSRPSTMRSSNERTLHVMCVLVV